MLVLLSFALVLVATVLLVLGLLNDGGLTLIYISIACSAAAALVLVIAVRLAKPRDDQRSLAPEPLPEPEPEPVGAGAPAAAPASSPAAGSEPATGEWLASDQDRWAEPGAAAAAAPAAPPADDELEFPIADYDELTVGQILPLLPQLYADELDVVEERERLTKGRTEVLSAVAELREAGTADDLAGDEEWFPIEDYDRLSVSQIRPLIGELDDDELILVREREAGASNRRTILDEIDRRLGRVSAKKAAATRAPAKKAAGKKAATKRAPAKKSAAKRTAATRGGTKRSATKKATAKKSTAKRSATKKATAKKSAAKKSAAKKSAAKKASARRR